MLHRIFLAINLPEAIKTELQSLQARLPELPIRWVNPENLHITLVFVGNTSDKELETLQENCRRIGEGTKPFSFQFSELSYGPSSANPRMVWLKGKAPKALARLQKNLQEAVQSKSAFGAPPEKYPFVLHLTLGRLKEYELQTIELEELPNINQDVSYDIPVSSFEIMESSLKKTGAEYATIESIQLGK